MCMYIYICYVYFTYFIYSCVFLSFFISLFLSFFFISFFLSSFFICLFVYLFIKYFIIIVINVIITIEVYYLNISGKDPNQILTSAVGSRGRVRQAQLVTGSGPAREEKERLARMHVNLVNLCKWWSIGYIIYNYIYIYIYNIIIYI